MKSLLITLTSALVCLIPLHAEGIKSIKGHDFFKACLNYPYTLGIEYKQGQGNSFQLLSTSIVNILDDNPELILIAFEEANLKAKVNIARLLQLANIPNDNMFHFETLPIRKNEKIITSKKQLEKHLTKFSESTSVTMRGIRELDSCYKKGNYVLKTVELTDQTIRSAEELNLYMKEN